MLEVEEYKIECQRSNGIKGNAAETSEAYVHSERQKGF
jgi:hypothetical protein